MEGENRKDNIPLYLKLVYTALYVFLAYITVHNYGWMSMLWFSQTALFVVLIGMWLESRLLLSMASLSILFFHSLWTLGFLMRLLTGSNLVGGLDYMFDPQISLFLRSLSLYHVLLPLLIIWILRRKGYDPDALKFQTLLGWTVATVVFLFTPPYRNINWVFGPRNPQNAISPSLYLLLVMVFLVAVVYLPTHLLLKRYFHK